MNIYPFGKNHILFKTAFAAAVAASALMAVGCTAKSAAESAADIPAGTLLVDCYRTTSAAEDNGYCELVLYTTESADTVKLCIFIRDSADADEICTTYLVPYKAAQDCFDIINKHHLENWESMEDTTSLDGALTVCKFYSGGSYIRVSTEKMPPDGDKILESISNVMQTYATADSAVPDSSETEVVM